MTEEKKTILEVLKNTYCRVMPSPIAGVGVFAIRDIPAGTQPFFGQILTPWIEFTLDELEQLDPTILKMIDDFFVIEKDRTVKIPRHGLNGMDVSFFINHSEQPNVETIDGGETFITMRPIKKGEELTVSYATYDDKYKKA